MGIFLEKFVFDIIDFYISQNEYIFALFNLIGKISEM